MKVRQLVCVEPLKVDFREVEVHDAGTGQVRVRNLFGVEKHGTMTAFFRGYANERGRWDEQKRIHLAEGVLWKYPIPLGNMQWGEIDQVGERVEGYDPGDKVFYSGPFQPFSVVAASALWRAPQGRSWKDALMLDPAEFALGALRDGHVRIGDRVAIFGMGAIGLTCVQLAVATGCAETIAVDPLPERRQVALDCGASVAISAQETDVGGTLRDLTSGVGPDVIIDFSGSPAALQAALRGVAYRGTIVCGAFPPPWTQGLDLGGEAHMNRPTIVFSRACSDPNPDYPNWDHRRIQETCYQLIAEGAVFGEPVIGPIVPFDSLLEPYIEIAMHSGRGTKLAVDYGA
ncbi:MAG: zinc-dependent alcohol dehydrogenase [Fimbriimonadaceae bacterium]